MCMLDRRATVDVFISLSLCALADAEAFPSSINFS